MLQVLIMMLNNNALFFCQEYSTAQVHVRCLKFDIPIEFMHIGCDKVMQLASLELKAN